MKRPFIVSILLSFVLLLAVTVNADNEPDRHNAKTTDTGIQLSDDLRKLLSEEMLAIQGGMQKLIVAIASGDWETISNVATKIKESYIVKQKLSKEQMEELHHALPAGFKVFDHLFHSSAGKLANAAKEHDRELVSFYYYKLTEGCVRCHSRYVKDRFPDFGINADKHRDH